VVSIKETKEVVEKVDLDQVAENIANLDREIARLTAEKAHWQSKLTAIDNATVKIIEPIKEIEVIAK